LHFDLECYIFAQVGSLHGFNRQDTIVIFEWSVYPFRDHPRRAALFSIVMITVLILLWWSFESIGWVLFGALVLGGSLHRLWLPASYRLTDDEIVSRQGFIRITRRLSDFRRIVILQHGAFLSPFAEPNRLEQYRGFFLPFPAESEPIERFLLRRFSGEQSSGE
jgi:hypothetical protein